MATVIRGKILREDLANWDGRNNTASRPDATGGKTDGVPLGDAVDVLTVYGSSRNRLAIATAIQRIGAVNATLLLSQGTWTIDSDLAIPSNFNIRLPAGAKVSVSSGVTLTINGTVIADVPGDLYTGSGSVVVSDEGGHFGNYFKTAAETSASVTPVNFRYPPGHVLRYGTNTTPGTTDMAPAFEALATLLAQGVNDLIVPPGTYLIGSQVTFTVPAKSRASIWGYGAVLKTSGAISAIRLSSGNPTGGLTVYGVQVDHRDNADAIAGFELIQTWNCRLVDCAVDADDVSADYACFLLRNSDPASAGTGCFWTVLSRCQTRRQSGTGGSRAPCGIRLRGAANRTVIRDCKIGDVDTGIHHTPESGQTYLANGILVTGCEFAGYTTAYHCDADSGSTLGGVRITGNSFEDGTTVFSFTGAPSVAVAPELGPNNYFISNAGTYLNNPDDLQVNIRDSSITPIITPMEVNHGARTITSQLGSAHALELKVNGGLRGLRLNNSDGNPVAQLVWDSTGGTTRARLMGGSALLRQTLIGGISRTSTVSENLRGSVTFASAATAAVDFGTDEPDANYFIAISGNAAETFHVTGKATTGFTINSSNAASTATVDWILIR